MRHVLLYSVLLLVGLGLSQALPFLIGTEYGGLSKVITLLTMFCLSFIMIHVGFEFQLDKGSKKKYVWDYIVAATAAAFPWIFCTLYFVLYLYPAGSFFSIDVWQEALLGARFASPTSAGVLFSMLAAAGLAATWSYQKARILAIFDDLDTVLFMIPLQMMIVGFRLELFAVLILLGIQLWVAVRWFHSLEWNYSWPWVLFYALLITLGSEGLHMITEHAEGLVAIHIEVLFPAFVLGCIIRKPKFGESKMESENAPKGFLEEKHVSAILSAAFMFLVGLSMPSVVFAVADSIDWVTMGWHVLLITFISNVGKLFPAFCYRNEAHWKERLAVAVSMFPRGEVGAGVLIISLGYGLNDIVLLVAILSMAVNLLLTGIFIYFVKKLLKSYEQQYGFRVSRIS